MKFPHCVLHRIYCPIWAQYPLPKLGLVSTAQIGSIIHCPIWNLLLICSYLFTILISLSRKIPLVFQARTHHLLAHYNQLNCTKKSGPPLIERKIQITISKPHMWSIYKIEQNWLPHNPYSSLTIRYLKRKLTIPGMYRPQCGHFRIFLSCRFYVKLIV